MDAGTDLNLIFAYYPNVPAGVSATLDQVISTNIPSRVQRLADEIRTNQPDFIALQEVTEWRTGVCGATTVLYDQLQLLQEALAARNTPYTTLAADTLNRGSLMCGGHSTERGRASPGRSISRIPPAVLLSE